MIDDTDPAFAPPVRRRRTWLPILILCLIAFIAGIAATIWAIRRSPLAHDRIAGAPQIVRVAVPVPAPPTTPSSRGGGGDNSPAIAALTGRVGALETRVDEVGEDARAAVGDAGRAEGLLLAVAARRALDGGIQLGYLEGLLRARFARTHADAVAMILSAARQPVTLDQLRSELDTIAPALIASDNHRTWWSGVKTELRSLIVVRRIDMASAAPADRVKRAERLLDDGHVDGALAEVARLPARAAAARWIAEARRYLAARHALETIETAALLEPDPAPIAVAPNAALSPAAPSNPAPPDDAAAPADRPARSLPAA